MTPARPLTCPLCLTALPSDRLPLPRHGDDPLVREEQKRLDRALWAAVHALQEQAAAADRLLGLQPAERSREAAAELHAQVDLLHAVLSRRGR